MAEHRSRRGGPARKSARKCSDISDAVLLQAVADTPAPRTARPAVLPAVDGPDALAAARLIRDAIAAGGWEPRTPHRTADAVYATLLTVMDVPVKVFHAKARLIEERRGLLCTSDGEWHLAGECLDEDCCGEAPPAAVMPLVPVSEREAAYMRHVLAREHGLAEQHPAGLDPYDMTGIRPYVPGKIPPLYRPIPLPRAVPRQPAAPDLRASVRTLISGLLAAPNPVPSVEEFRRRVLDAAEIPVGDDGWIPGQPRPRTVDRAGCRFEYGTWIHYPPHTCPGYVRGDR